MSFHNLYTYVLLILFCSNSAWAQADVIADLGNTEITRNEFRIRFELSPKILSGLTGSADSIELKFLYSLIAEKLWALEAVNQGLAKSEKFNFYFSPIQKLYIRDEFFRKQIKDKSLVTGEEVSEGVKKYNRVLKLGVFSASDSSEIFGAYKQLQDLKSPDSLTTSLSGLQEKFSSMELKFGDLQDESLENKLYDLNVADYTEPLKYKNAWFIFELYSSKPNLSQLSQNEVARDVEEIIRNRKIHNLYDNFFKKHFSEYTLEADSTLFLKIAEEFFKVLESRQNTNQLPSGDKKIYLTENDILKVRENLNPDYLDQILFRTRYGPVTADEFLSDLTLVDVGISNLDPDNVKKSLAIELNRFMQQEVIYRIAEKQGVKISDELEVQLKMWKDNLLAQLMKNTYNSKIKVSEAEIVQLYNEVYSDSTGIFQLDLEILTTPDLMKVGEILEFIENGKSFNHIVKQFDENQNVKYETVTNPFELWRFGEIANIIYELNAGDIYGPITTEEGYSLIKIRESVAIDDSIKTDIKKIRDSVKEAVFFRKIDQLLESETIKLADKYGVEFSEDLLYSEEYLPVNFFVQRYFGFGGRISAVPITTPFYKWFYRWKNKNNVFP